MGARVAAMIVVMAIAASACTAPPQATKSDDAGGIGQPVAVGVATNGTLTILSGNAWVRFGDGAYEDAVDGDELVAGDTIRTDEDSYVVLAFANGAIIELEPESELTVEELAINSAGDFTLLARQEEGESWHVADGVLTPNSRYEVATDDMTTGVEGTSFKVSSSQSYRTTLTTFLRQKGVQPDGLLTNSDLYGLALDQGFKGGTGPRETKVATTTGSVNATSARAPVITKKPAPAPTAKPAAKSGQNAKPVPTPARRSTTVASRPSAKPVPAPKPASALPPKIVPPATARPATAPPATTRTTPNAAQQARTVPASTAVKAGQGAVAQQPIIQCRPTDNCGFAQGTGTAGATRLPLPSGTIAPNSDVYMSAGPPKPTAIPSPPATVKMTLDGTPANAAAVDAKGRAVGVSNGQAVRYIPGSTVEVENGKLVMTVPGADPGRISTMVKDAKPNTSVLSSAPNLNVYNIQTEVFAANVGRVANIVEARPIGSDGTVKGGVTATQSGLIALPQADAQTIAGVKLASQPSLPPTIKFDPAKAPTPPTVVTPDMAKTVSSTLPTGVQAADMAKIAADTTKGGFQAYQTSPGAVAAPTFTAFTKPPDLGKFGSASMSTVPSGLPTGPPAGVPTGPPAGIQTGPPGGIPTGPPSQTGPPAGIPTGPPAGIPTELTIGRTGPPSATEMDEMIKQFLPTGFTMPTSGSGPTVFGPPPGTPTGPPPGTPTGPPAGIPTGPPAGIPTGPPAGIPTGPPAGIPTGPPAGIPAGPPEGIPTGPPAGIPSGPPAGIPTGPPAGIPSGPPTGIPTGPPAGIPTGPPAGMPTGAPAGIPTGPPAGIPTGPPAGMPTGAPAGIPTGPPVNIPSAPPVQIPQVPQAPPAGIPRFP